MNTSDLVAKIAGGEWREQGAQAQAIVDSMLNSIMSAAANGRRFRFQDLESSKSRKRPANVRVAIRQAEKIKIARFPQAHLFACQGGQGNC